MSAPPAAVRRFCARCRVLWWFIPAVQVRCPVCGGQHPAPAGKGAA